MFFQNSILNKKIKKIIRLKNDNQKWKFEMIIFKIFINFNIKKWLLTKYFPFLVILNLLFVLVLFLLILDLLFGQGRRVVKLNFSRVCLQNVNHIGKFAVLYFFNYTSVHCVVENLALLEPFYLPWIRLFTIILSLNYIYIWIYIISFSSSSLSFSNLAIIISYRL